MLFSNFKRFLLLSTCKLTCIYIVLCFIFILFPFYFIFVQIEREIMTQEVLVTGPLFPMITGHGTKKVLLMKFEILGLAIMDINKA